MAKRKTDGIDFDPQIDPEKEGVDFEAIDFQPANQEPTLGERAKKAAGSVADFVKSGVDKVVEGAGILKTAGKDFISDNPGFGAAAEAAGSAVTPRMPLIDKAQDGVPVGLPGAAGIPYYQAIRQLEEEAYGHTISEAIGLEALKDASYNLAPVERMAYGGEDPGTLAILGRTIGETIAESIPVTLGGLYELHVMGKAIEAPTKSAVVALAEHNPKLALQSVVPFDKWPKIEETGFALTSRLNEASLATRGRYLYPQEAEAIQNAWMKRMTHRILGVEPAGSPKGRIELPRDPEKLTAGPSQRPSFEQEGGPQAPPETPFTPPPPPQTPAAAATDLAAPKVSGKAPEVPAAPVVAPLPIEVGSGGIPGARNPAKMAPEEFLDSGAWRKEAVSHYFDSEGRRIASSRSEPAQDAGLVEGTWRREPSGHSYGHEIDQLLMVDPKNLTPMEDTYAMGRGGDVAQYKEWLKGGKNPPPILVVEADNGEFRIIDGHRRWHAAKELGVKVPAWVSYSETLPGKVDAEGKPLKVGLTHELAIERGGVESRVALTGTAPASTVPSGAPSGLPDAASPAGPSPNLGSPPAPESPSTLRPSSPYFTSITGGANKSKVIGPKAMTSPIKRLHPLLQRTVIEDLRTLRSDLQDFPIERATKSDKDKAPRYNPDGIIAYIIKRGGISIPKSKGFEGELEALSKKESGIKGLVTRHPNKGIGISNMAEEAASDTPASGIKLLQEYSENALLDAISKESVQARDGNGYWMEDPPYEREKAWLAMADTGLTRKQFLKTIEVIESGRGDKGQQVEQVKRHAMGSRLDLIISSWQEIHDFMADAERSSSLTPDQAQKLKDSLIRDAERFHVISGEDFLPEQVINDINLLTHLAGASRMPAGVAEGGPQYGEVPGFYSKLESEIEKRLPEKASVEQVEALLRDVKQEERDWTGIDGFLAGKSKVTKAEVLSFLQANRLEVSEVVKGEQKLAPMASGQEDFNIRAENAENRKQEIQTIFEGRGFDLSMNMGGDDAVIERRHPKYTELPEGTTTKRSPHGDWWEVKLPGAELPILPASTARLYTTASSIEDAALAELNEGAKFVEPETLEAEAPDLMELATEYARLSSEIVDAEVYADDGGTKFGQYTLPGGTNYRELLFTLPGKMPPGFEAVEMPDGKWGVQFQDGKTIGGWNSREAAIASQKSQPGSSSFHSTHFDEPNIIAHTRIKDRVDADGKKVLFIEEIQSDWHQKGRREGYKDPEVQKKLEALDAERVSIEERGGHYLNANQVRRPADIAMVERWKTVVTEIDKLKRTLGSGVPDAPLKNTWHEFVLKRLVRYAAERGYDSIAWTTGEQQADRYDLSHQVKSIYYSKGADLGQGHVYNVWAIGNSGRRIEIGEHKAERLPDVVGKDVADKIIAGKGTRSKEAGEAIGYKISGTDLKVGGEGMRGFYDKMVPAFLNKFGKRFGASTGSMVLKAGPGHSMDAESTIGKVHSFPITDALKTSAMTEGFPIFDRGSDYSPARLPSEQDIAFGKTPQQMELDLGIELAKVQIEGVDKTRFSANDIVKELKARGFIDFRGKSAKNVRQIAELAAVFRNPKFENFQVFVLKNGKVVAHRVVSINHPSAVAVPESLFKDIYSMALRLGADGIYLAHNHPSGVSTPSAEDRGLTKSWHRASNGLVKGHIVTNGKDYHVINIIESGGWTSSSIDRQEFKGDHPDYAAGRKPLARWGVTPDSNDMIAMLSKENVNDKQVSIVFLDPRSQVIAIESIRPEGKAAEHAVHRMRFHGATSVAFVVPKGHTIGKVPSETVDIIESFGDGKYRSIGSGSLYRHRSHVDSMKPYKDIDSKTRPYNVQDADTPYNPNPIGVPPEERPQPNPPPEDQRTGGFGAAINNPPPRPPIDEPPLPTGGSGGNGPVRFSSPETEARFQAAKGGIKKPEWRQRFSELVTTMWNEMSREFEHLPKGAKFSELRFALTKLQKAKSVVTDMTVRALNALTDPLSPEEFDIFTRKVILDDLAREAEAGRKLPFGLDPQRLVFDKSVVDMAVGRSAKLTTAVAKRRAMWDGLKTDYINAMGDIGFNVTDRLRNEAYFRHQVLEYASTQAVASTTKGLHTPAGRGFLKKREGSSLDINANYIQAEFEVLAQMQKDVEIAKVIKLIKDRHDMSAELKQAAKTHNKSELEKVMLREQQAAQAVLQAAVQGPAPQGQAAPLLPVTMAMRGFAQRLAIAFGQVNDAVVRGAIDPEVAEKWSSVVSNIVAQAGVLDFEGDGETTAPGMSMGDPDLFKFLADLAQAEGPGSLAARGIFKAISERRQFVQDTLGEKYRTWQMMLPEDHALWQPQEGNLFFFVDTIPSKVAQALHANALESIGITAADLRKVLTSGGRRTEYALPVEIVKQLQQFGVPAPSTVIGDMSKISLGVWKRWQLMSPHRLLRYNLRNITGDADAVFVGNPSAFKKVPQAMKDLKDVMFSWKEAQGEVLEWMRRGGYETTLKVQELGDLNDVELFKKFYDGANTMAPDWLSMPIKPFKAYWNGAQVLTQYRESIMRYAAYVDYLEQIQRNGGRPDNYGASIPEEIDALYHDRDKAFKLSNELLGAYDGVSVAGQAMRAHLYPFWSWNEVNMRRYIQFFKNAAEDERLAGAVGRAAVGASGRLAVRIGAFLVKATAFWTALQVYNNTMFPEEERQLDEFQRNRPHIIFGKNNKGEVWYFPGVGALGDALSWFGLDVAPRFVDDWFRGKMTLAEIAKEMAKSPVNKLAQGLSPFIKLPLEAATRMSIYPTVFEPHQIRDMGQYLFRSVALGDEYNALFDVPSRGYLDSLKTILLYKIDPGQGAYSDIQNLKRRFLAKEGKTYGGFASTPKSEALYYYKLSLRFGDDELGKKYLKQYVALGGKLREMNQSLKQMDPLSGLSHLEKARFFATLNMEERAKLRRANKFYVEFLRGYRHPEVPGSTKDLGGPDAQ